MPACHGSGETAGPPRSARRAQRLLLVQQRRLGRSALAQRGSCPTCGGMFQLYYISVGKTVFIQNWHFWTKFRDSS